MDEAVREIAEQQRRLIFFVDDNLCANREAAKALFRAITPLRIRWVSQSSLDMLRNAALMDLMLQSGCLGHVIGFESISPGNLLGMSKGHNLHAFDGYRSQVHILRDYGLQTWAAFLLGYDHETRDSVRRTLDFALESRFTFAAFNMLTPYPGTPLYQSLLRQGRLLYGGKWWLHPDYRFNYAPFQPARMSAEALTEACFEARARFSSVPSLLHRLRYAQFYALRTNEVILLFERFLVRAILPPMARRLEASGMPVLRQVLLEMLQEEQAHDAVFTALNRASRPDLYQNADFCFFPPDGKMRRLIAFMGLAAHRLAYPLWLLFFIEESSLTLARDFLAVGQDHELGPAESNWLAVHQEHTHDERRHTLVDRLLFQACYARRGIMTRRLDGWLFQRLLKAMMSYISRPSAPVLRISPMQIKYVDQPLRAANSHQLSFSCS